MVVLHSSLVFFDFRRKGTIFFRNSQPIVIPRYSPTRREGNFLFFELSILNFIRTFVVYVKNLHIPFGCGSARGALGLSRRYRTGGVGRGGLYPKLGNGF